MAYGNGMTRSVDRTKRKAKIGTYCQGSSVGRKTRGFWSLTQKCGLESYYLCISPIRICNETSLCLCYMWVSCGIHVDFVSILCGFHVCFLSVMCGFCGFFVDVL